MVHTNHHRHVNKLLPEGIQDRVTETQHRRGQVLLHQSPERESNEHQKEQCLSPPMNQTLHLPQHGLAPVLHLPIEEVLGSSALKPQKA
ncbi:hypothetical protein OIU78_012585 [Salix suchowensis]|nr:hypothetical protein OIU78_012585 [Salix suchowensis]